MRAVGWCVWVGWNPLGTLAAIKAVPAPGPSSTPSPRSSGRGQRQPARRDARALARAAIREHGAAQKEGELTALTRLLQSRRLRCVLEIGTMDGGTLWLWLQLAEPDAVVVSIDLPGGPFGGGYGARDAVRFRSWARSEQRLSLIRGDSHAPAIMSRCRRFLGGRPIDLLFIDGDHSYVGCRRDFELYAPLVDPLGVIAFHDVVPHPGAPGCEVDRVWRELATRGRAWEFVERGGDRGWGPWGGIGVVERHAVDARFSTDP